MATSSSSKGATVVWLHGLGDRAETFEWLKDEIPKVGGTALDWVFPESPIRESITANFFDGPVPAWMDMPQPPLTPALVAGMAEDPQILESIQIVEGVVSGILTEDVILGGFSQGGAIALLVALRRQSDVNIKGVICCGGWLVEPLLDSASFEGTPLPPVLWYHGDQDRPIPIAAQTWGGDYLKTKLGYEKDKNLTSVEASGVGHAVTKEQGAPEIADWLTKVLA